MLDRRSEQNGITRKSIMSFLTLCCPNKKRLGIDAQRRKPSGQGAAALLGRNPDGTTPLTFVVVNWSRCSGLLLLPKPLQEISDQSSQPGVFELQLLYLRHVGGAQSSETPPPSIECSQRYTRGVANFRDRHAGASFIEQMKNFAFSEPGTSHQAS